MTDKDLLAAHLQGDRTALAALLDRHESPLIRFARGLLPSDDLAQDAVQETFMKLLREGRRMLDVEALFPWLVQVTRNACLDLLRREGRMERRHEEAGRATAAAVADPPEGKVLAEEARDRVRDAVAKLPDPQRSILRMKLWEGLTYREIAKRLDMTLTNVSYHLGEAVRAVGGELRVVLGGEK